MSATVPNKKRMAGKAPAVAGKKHAGRPSERERVDLNQVEAVASLGYTDEEIARTLGVARSTLSRWKDDEQFQDTLKRGKLKADVKVIQSLYNKAIGKRVIVKQTQKGPVEQVIQVDPDTTAIIFWLKNRRPDMYRDSQRIDGNLNITGKMSMAQLKKSIKLIERADARA